MSISSSSGASARLRREPAGVATGGDPRPGRDGAAADRASRRERAGHHRHPGRGPAVLRVGHLPTGDGPAVDFLLPGALALRSSRRAWSTSGSRRPTAELRRPQATRRVAADARRPVGSKAGAVLWGVAQVVLVAIAAVVLDWRARRLPCPLRRCCCSARSRSGLGLLLARARAEATLPWRTAFHAFLLLGGSCSVSHLPGPLAALAEVLPAAALSERSGSRSGRRRRGGGGRCSSSAHGNGAVRSLRTFRWE
jgi:hypothetical protein